MEGSQRLLVQEVLFSYVETVVAGKEDDGVVPGGARVDRVENLAHLVVHK